MVRRAYLDPAAVAIDGVGREPNQLNATFGEFWLEFREGTELCRAHRGIIFRVGEKDYPFVANEPKTALAERQQNRAKSHTRGNQWARLWCLL